MAVKKSKRGRPKGSINANKAIGPVVIISKGKRGRPRKDLAPNVELLEKKVAKLEKRLGKMTGVLQEIADNSLLRKVFGIGVRRPGVRKSTGKRGRPPKNNN
ncbi:MAG: hypothetical protein ACK40M_08625 [Flavobacteriales bacterium]